ncbi:MAG TPA: chromate transporter [Treponemataceae bacterium]|nr:chromate transporter [Treponemataceae bacterium]
MSLWSLFWVFFYVGAFTIGGGLVAISLMQQELVGRGLISVERFYNMVAISESTPGPIGINMATYIGFELHGVFGGIITTIGTVLPSLIVIIIIARFFGKFQDIPVVKAAFYGLRAGTTGMIGVAAFQVMRVAIFRLPAFSVSGNWLDICSWPALGLFIGVLALNQKFNWHPVFFIVMGGVFGAFFL